jgi:hypothetical protein
MNRSDYFPGLARVRREFVCDLICDTFEPGETRADMLFAARQMNGTEHMKLIDSLNNLKHC